MADFYQSVIFSFLYVESVCVMEHKKWIWKRKKSETAYEKEVAEKVAILNLISIS